MLAGIVSQVDFFCGVSGGSVVSQCDDLGIVASPVLTVSFEDDVNPAEDVSDEALSAGAGTEGNQFEFIDTQWRYNLKTKNYSASGTYTVTMESGDSDEYVIDPQCSAEFVIN